MMNRLEINDIKKFQEIAKVLATDMRTNIYHLLQRGSYNVNEIAEILNVPISTVSVNLKKMEQVGIISMESLPAEKGGTQKRCSLKYQEILYSPIEKAKKAIESNLELKHYSMPVGNFVNFQASIPCGLTSDKEIIGKFDHLPSFYLAERIEAQLIWFENGFLEYRFPNEIPKDHSIHEIQFGAEICSEHKGHKNAYPSDITLWINEIEAGTWTSQGDYGGKRGKFTPRWWSINSTQYGKHKIWKITPTGTFVDEKKRSSFNTSQLGIENHPFISIKIGVKNDAINKGGINLFGSKFGNHDSDLELKIYHYKRNDEF